MAKKETPKLEPLFDLYPLDLSEPSVINEEMKQGLAEVYANKGYRYYIEHAVKTANKNMIQMLDAGDMENAKRFANRISTLMQLISKGREQYLNFEKIKSKVYAEEKSKEIQEET